MGQFDIAQRKSSYFFHLGALDSNFVEVSKYQKINDKQISLLTKENEKYRTIVDTLRAGLDQTQMSFDSESLEKAISTRQAEIKKILNEIAKVRKSLLEAEDRKIQLEYEKDVLSKYIKKKQPDVEVSSGIAVECPRCGMMFAHSMTQQLEKIYLLESLHDDYTNISEELVLINRKISKYRSKFAAKQKILGTVGCSSVGMKDQPRSWIS